MSESVVEALSRAQREVMPERRLAALLDAWRIQRHPRIANVIDRLSDAQRVSPIKAASVRERLEQVAALCRRGGPLDVATVLASEWPARATTAEQMLRSLRRLPADPRVARNLAQQIDARRIREDEAFRFYRGLYAALDALADVRNLPLLRAQLTRGRSIDWDDDPQEASARLHSRLKIRALPRRAEVLLDLLESNLPTPLKRPADGRGAELLEAIFERPDDLSLRAVYGDWLSERNDPRGEFIQLQLGALA